MPQAAAELTVVCFYSTVKCMQKRMSTLYLSQASFGWTQYTCLTDTEVSAHAVRYWLS